MDKTEEKYFPFQKIFDSNKDKNLFEVAQGYQDCLQKYIGNVSDSHTFWLLKMRVEIPYRFASKEKYRGLTFSELDKLNPEILNRLVFHLGSASSLMEAFDEEIVERTKAMWKARLLKD